MWNPGDQQSRLSACGDLMGQDGREIDGGGVAASLWSVIRVNNPRDVSTDVTLEMGCKYLLGRGGGKEGCCNFELSLSDLL